MLLYHYTDAKGLYGILKSKTLWASSYQFLNDATEFEYAFDLIKDVYPQEDSNPSIGPMSDFRIAENIRKERYNYISDCLFVVSFSEKDDLLGQWRAYAGPYSGYSLGFRSSKLDAHKNAKLVACNYDKGKQLEDIKDLIEKLSAVIRESFELPPESGEQNRRNSFDKLISQRLDASKKMLSIAKSFKHSSFKDEKEWRLVFGPLPEDSEEICYRLTKLTVTPYAEIDFSSDGLPIERIVVGPGPHQKRSAHSLSQMLKKLGFENVKVSQSKIPYRNW